MKSISIILSLKNPPKIFCGDFKDIRSQKMMKLNPITTPFCLSHILFLKLNATACVDSI